jgi:hypothetical protein
MARKFFNRRELRALGVPSWCADGSSESPCEPKGTRFYLVFARDWRAENNENENYVCAIAT